MNGRERALAPVLFTIVSIVYVMVTADSAYAASVVDLSVDGAKSSPNSFAELQNALKSAGGKNKNVTIDLNQDIVGDPIELPDKTTVTFNLNGHTINRNLTSQNSSGHTLQVGKNSRVTINGGEDKTQKQVRTWNPNGTTTWRTLDASGLITGGYSTNKSGGIYLKSGARLTLNNVTIAGCRSEQKGGSDGYGGGIWAGGSDITVALNNSNVCYNYAYNDGGGIAGTSKLFNLFMTNSKVSFNYAKRDGGGIALQGSLSTVSGDSSTTVSNNSCGDKYGGGVYVNQDSSSVSGFSVEHNEAKYGGGVATRNHSIKLSSLKVHGNSAEYGGGVYIGDFTNIVSTATDSMGGCTITGNSTRNNRGWGKGAGVYVVGGGRGWFVKSFSLEIGGKTIIKDNGNGSGNLVFGSTSVHPNFTLTGDSDVLMGYEAINEDAVQVTHDRLKGPNCIRYLKAENSGYHFTYNSSASKRKIFYVRDGKDNADKYGTSYGERQEVGRISPADAAPKADGKNYNGYPVTRGYVRFPSGVEEGIDIATPFFFSDGYFFDNPASYNNHLATTSMCMAMSGFYLNTGNKQAVDGYINKHASARQFMADIGCDDQNTYVNDFNVQKPGIDTIGVTISHKELKNTDGKGSGYYLVPVAIRGSNYEAEWTSNVTLNTAKNVRDAQAAGFTSAADKVFQEINTYIKKYNLPVNKIKFWVAGYSRAGATTNLVCKRLIDAWSSNRPQVFGYPMEAPQGGTNTTYDDRSYFSIHNVINQADLVPLVAPSAMGFKRYGVDHYIPGTAAGDPQNVENDSVERGGNGGPAHRYLYADNSPTYTNSQEYNNAGAVAQLKAIDPNIVFDDYFATCGMDFVPSPNIFEKSTGKTVVYEEKFIRDFVNELQAGAISNRDYYASDLEPTFRTVMGMLFGMEPSRSKAFIDRASTTMNRFDTLVASWNDHSMFRIWYSLIGKWNKASADKKKEYTDLIYKKLKETDALGVLTKEERAKFDDAWPKLFDFIMRVLDRDYNTKSYDTAKMMMLGTFGYNTSRIMANHLPEVTLAWLRSYDDYYNNERTATALQNAQSVLAPSASVGKRNLKAGADQTNVIPTGKQTVTLDVADIKGEAIYYKLSGAKTSPNTCKVGYDIYRGGIDLGRVKRDDSYTITTYAISYGTKSAEVTYNINVDGALHSVVVYNENDAQLKKISQTYEWTEGSQQKIEAKGTTNWQFDKWRVWDEKAKDVTAKVLPNGDDNKQTATLTMPEGGENGFSDDYELTVIASFKWSSRVYPKHAFTVKIGDITENFQVEENQTFRYDATNKIPAGKYFKEWKVTDQTDTDVTEFMRPAYRNSNTNSLKWDAVNKPNMYCEVIGNNQTVYQSGNSSHVFAQGYSLTFEAQLEDIATINEIKITGVGEAMHYGSKMATIEYYAGTSKVHQLHQIAYWKRDQNTTKNEDTTVATTTTYEAILNCPAVAGKPFAADDALSVRAQVDGQYVDDNSDYKVAWKRKNNGAIQVTITKTETTTTGTPTFTYQVEARACDKNDADRNVLVQNGNEIKTNQSFKAGADGVFRFYNGPVPSGDNWKFCGYEAAADSGLEKVNANDPYDNTFKVVDKTKPLAVNMLCVPEISQIDVSQFPQPATDEPLASANDEGIDFAYVLPEESVFADAFATWVKSLSWSPEPGEDQKAAGNTAYTAELELECVKSDNSNVPYECAFAQGGVTVSTNAEQPAFEYAAFDDKTGKLYLTFKRTDRSTDHEILVKNNAVEGDPATYTWREGEVKSVTAEDDYEDKYFTGWTVKVNELELDPNVSDASVATQNKAALQQLGLFVTGDVDKRSQRTAKVTLPAPDEGDVFVAGYTLSLTANYHTRAKEVRVNIAWPTGEETNLADDAALSWTVDGETMQSATVPVSWTATEAYSETQVNNTFVANMRLDAATARQFMRSENGEACPTVIIQNEDPSKEIVGTATWNADGSLTITATFGPITSALPAYKVSVGHYDVNHYNVNSPDDSKLAGVSDADQIVVDETGDSDGFTLSAPVIEGAEFVRWEIPDGSKIQFAPETGENSFKFVDGASAQDACTIRALYKPLAQTVELCIDAPVAAQQLATSATAQIGLVNADAFVNASPTVATALTWTPSSAEGKAAYDTEYDVAVTLSYTYKKVVNGQEQDASWLCGYAQDTAVDVSHAGSTKAPPSWFDTQTHTAYVYFPETERDDSHQATIRDFAEDDTDMGEPKEETWYEGETKYLVAKQYDDKLFTGWTIMRTAQGIEAEDVTSAVLVDGAKASDVTIGVKVPTADTGDFPEGYSLAITANYVNKFDTINVSVPQPSPDSEELPEKATLTWGNNQTAQVDIGWSYDGDVIQAANGESKTVKHCYTAIMQLDEQTAQVFKWPVTVNATVAQPDQTAPTINQERIERGRLPEGGAVIVIPFNPIETNIESRKVVVQACDVNTADKTKLEGTTDEKLTLFVDESDPFAVYAPEVEGAEFAGWDVPSTVTKVDAPQPDPQDGNNVSKDGLTVGFFQFKDGAPATTNDETVYTIKAKYKPVVSVVQTKFAAPRAGQTMATKENATASFRLQSKKFSAVPVRVKTLVWDPAAEVNGTAAYGKEYEATVTLEPSPGKEFAYAADLLPDYEVPDEGDEDDAAMVNYTAVEPPHTIYVSFDKTEQLGLQNIKEPNPIVATNDKNNKEALKALLPTQVDIEVVGSNVNKADVIWQDPVCDENGGKAYESFWHAEGTVIPPEGVSLPSGITKEDLKVGALIYVAPADKLNLLDVEQPADLLDVDPDSNIKDQLPITTTLTLDDGVQEEVEIVWDEPTLVENGEDINVSVWNVTGKVKEPLPSWINNPNGEGHVDLSLSLNAYVNPPDRRHEPADTPYATLDDGIFDLSQIIYLDSYNPNARIYFSTDSGDGLADFAEYVPGTPIYLDRTTTDEDNMMVIQAYATEEDKDPSEVVSYLYMLDEVIDVPVGEELVYNGEEQACVSSNENYSLLNPSAGSRIDEHGDAAATNVGTYTVLARIADKLQWKMGEVDEEGNVPSTTNDQTVTFRIVPASIKDCHVDAIGEQRYTNGAVEPKPLVTFNGKELVEGRDYTLSYKDNRGVGKAYVTITGKGNFKDSVTLEFVIMGEKKHSEEENKHSEGESKLSVTYAGHIQKNGDLEPVANGETLGTTGLSLRLEALSARVEGGSIEYRSHLQGFGWEKNWAKDGELSGTTGQSRRIEAVQMKLSEKMTEVGYSVWYRVHCQTYGWLGWARDGDPAGTSAMSKRLEAIQVIVLHGDEKPEDYDAAKSAFRSLVMANAHVQRDGWLGYAPAGVLGTTGQSRRLEAMWAKLQHFPYAGGIEYQAHVQRIGWQDWVSNGAVAGTSGRSLRMEAIRMRLTGEAADHLSLWYRPHVQGIGWTEWVPAEDVAGTTGQSLRCEAIDVIVLSKGAVPDR